MSAPRQIVTAPAFTPLPYGLLSVVDNPAPGDVHWQNGIMFQAACPITLGNTTYDECVTVTGTGNVPVPPAGPAGGGLVAPTVAYQLRGATPFTAVVEFDCSTVGNTEAARIAENAMAQAGSWQLERAFWTGTAGGQPVVYPHLAATVGVTGVSNEILQSPVVTGGAADMDIAEALGILEKRMADCFNGAGVIHVPLTALPTLDAWGLVKVNGGVLRTLGGNKVAAGSGYPGTSPTGAAPAAGTTWIYGTGPVLAYQSATRIGDMPASLNRAENTILMTGQKTFVLAWDCCHFGMLVKLGVPFNGAEAT